jgi:hypothetical protein
LALTPKALAGSIATWAGARTSTLRSGKKLEFRVQAFNFLNHPLPDFTLNGTDQQLSFVCASGKACDTSPIDPTSSVVNTNANTTGKPLYTIGRRVMELSIKYSF